MRMLAILAISISLSPTSWWIKLGPVFEAGVQAYSQGEYAQAAIHFSKALPANKHASFYNRALCHYQLGNWKLARMDFVSALQSSRDHAEKQRSMIALSATLLKAGRAKEALRQLAQTSRARPSQPQVAINLAGAHSASGDYSAALSSLDQAERLADIHGTQAIEMWRVILHHLLAKQRGQPTGSFLGIQVASSVAWPAVVSALGLALRIQPGFTPARMLLRSIRAAALKQGPVAIVRRVDHILASDLEVSKADQFPLAALDDRPLSGAPLVPFISPTWESYAGRWELLVLLAVVSVMLALYLRGSRKRRQVEPPGFVSSIRSRRSR